MDLDYSVSKVGAVVTDYVNDNLVGWPTSYDKNWGIYGHEFQSVMQNLDFPSIPTEKASYRTTISICLVLTAGFFTWAYYNGSRAY